MRVLTGGRVINKKFRMILVRWAYNDAASEDNYG